MKSLMVCMAVLTIVFGSLPEASAYLFAYPEKDQSPEQQTIDDAECQKQATRKTHFDFSMPLTPVGRSGDELIRQRREEHKRAEKAKEFQAVYGECMRKRGYAVPNKP